jgi:hypothetical protein
MDSQQSSLISSISSHVDLPALAEAFRKIREAGGLCAIADGGSNPLNLSDEERDELYRDFHKAQKSLENPLLMKQGEKEVPWIPADKENFKEDVMTQYVEFFQEEEENAIEMMSRLMPSSSNKEEWTVEDFQLKAVIPVEQSLLEEISNNMEAFLDVHNTTHVLSLENRFMAAYILREAAFVFHKSNSLPSHGFPVDGLLFGCSFNIDHPWKVSEVARVLLTWSVFHFDRIQMFLDSFGSNDCGLVTREVEY